MHLSPAQKIAVEYLDGPQIILAGAGSGKTRVIVAKARYLIENKGYDPKSLLIITYSNKTQEELEQRFADAGISDAEIKTFHAFGMDLLSEFGNLIRLPGPPEKFGSYREYQLLKAAISALPKSILLDTNNPDTVRYAIRQFISRAKDELVSPDEIIKRAEDEIGKIPFESGDDADWTALDRWQKILEAGQIYKLYESKKAEYNQIHKKGDLDYGDMIGYAHLLLKSVELVGAILRQKIKYVLVDEFQDTNFAQVEILHHLCGGKTAISVVGDDDQAIYRFRGASFGSFSLFKKLFQQSQVFRLEENYRSAKNIVHGAQALIEIDPNARFDSGKKMNATIAGDEKIAIRISLDDTTEAEAVAAEIGKLLEDEKYRQPQSIAVLVRARRHKDLLIKALQKRNFNFYFGQKVMEIQTKQASLLKWIYQFIVDANRGDLLSAIIRELLPGMTIALEKEINYALAKAELAPLDSIKALAGERSDHLGASLKGTIVLVEEFIALKGDHKPLPLLERIIAKLNLMSQIISDGQIIAPEALSEIASLLRTAENFQNETESPGHAEFLDYLEWQGLSESGINQEEEIKSPVVIQTVHSAKGLEYPVVFMIGLSNRRFPSSDRPSAVEFPSELYKDELPQGDFRIQEERRLFYVGMTRAREKLYLCGIRKKGTKISQFVSELEKSSDFEKFAEVQELAPTDIKLVESINSSNALDKSSKALVVPLEDSLENSARSAIISLWKVYTAKAQTPEEFQILQDGFQNKLSAALAGEMQKISDEKYSPPARATKAKIVKFTHSQIETFQTCPLKYYFGVILHIPTPSTPAMSFGNVIHDVLQQAGQILKSGEKLSLENLTTQFETHWKGTHFDDPDQKERLRQRGHEILKCFLQRQSEITGAPIELEKSFKIEFGESVLSGRIDRIDKTPDGLVIIDYKTGKKPKDTDLRKELQLPIYALACKSLFNEVPARLIYMFFGDDSTYEASFGEQNLENTRSEILTLIEEINKSDFTATPDKYKCDNCAYNHICPAKVK